MNKKKGLKWLIYKYDNKKFPYKLYIEESPNNFIGLKVQSRWPGPGKKIFCSPIGSFPSTDLPGDEPVEQCEIVEIWRYGKKLFVVLDRKTKKRCWFIFLKKEYKKKRGEFYEQVFWITKASEAIRRPGAYIPMVRDAGFCEIIVDTRERYPYKFGYLDTRKENLPVGDYALSKNGKIMAVAERKTLNDFLKQIPTYDSFKAMLKELSTYPYKVLIFESPYSDFLNPGKIKPYRATYIADIISDLYFHFPEVQIVFCDNRKLAQAWLLRWFLRINSEKQR